MSGFDLEAAQEELRTAAAVDAAENAFFPQHDSEADEPTPVPDSQEPAPKQQAAEPEDDEEKMPAWAKRLSDRYDELERRSIYQQHQPQYQQPQQQQPGWNPYAQQPPVGYPQYQQPQQQQVDRQPQRMLTDLDAERYEQQMQVVRAHYEALAKAAQSQEVKLFREAERRMAKDYPDFDEVIPAAQRQQALQIALQQGRLGNDWETNMSTAYKQFAFDRLARQRDELATKREAKREDGRSAASQIPPSGANYQAPTPKLEKFKRGYRDASSAFLADLRAGT